MSIDERALELKREGNRCVVKRDYESARKAFEQLISLEPSASEGYVGLAKVLDRVGDHDGVIKMLAPVVERLDSSQARKFYADSLRILANRGAQQLRRAAITEYEKLAKEREDPVSLFYLAELYEAEGEFHGALDRYDHSWRLDPRSHAARDGMLRCLAKLGRDEEMQSVKERWRQLQEPRH